MPDLVARHEQLVALRVLQDQVVALRSGERAVRDARVPADAVDPMDGEVAGLELVGDRVGAPAREPRRGPRVTPRAEEVLLGGDGHLGGGGDEAVRERRLHGIDLDRRAHELPHALQRTVAARGDEQAIVAGGQVGETCRELGGVALGAPPVGEAEVEPLRELRQVDLHMPPERVGERVQRRAAPATRSPRRAPRLPRRPDARGPASVAPAANTTHAPCGSSSAIVGMRSKTNGASVSAPSTNNPSAMPLEPVLETVRLQLRATRRRARGSRRPGSARAPAARATRAIFAVDNWVEGDELAERLDLFAPVLQADRTSGVAGEDVDDAAPNRELAPVLDQSARV